MCGIAGKVYTERGRQVEEELLHSMCQAMAHRGPDDEGFYREGSAGLCMRRLQIIDLAGGHQPMANEDGSVWIVFNGEIYNYRDLRKELEQRGHIFQTSSDTETILHLYEEKGSDCLEDLRGMFAFAIWDSTRQTLFLARDRLGKKPLYFAEGNGAITFASELGTLMCDADVDRAIDPQAIDEYLTYLFVPHPRTIYRGVRKLPPASYALFKKGQLEIERYWDVRYDRIEEKRGFAESVEELDTLLRQAVELRLLADVPLGAFLSGGLDSSLVVALMREASSTPVKTFSIGFEDSSFNELEYARQVAETLETEHEEYVVDYGVQELLPKLVAHFGEPFADSSAIPTYHLSRVTREKVTVALSGDGGDEIFGGYRRYQAGILAQYYNRWPGLLGRDAFERLVGAIREPATYYGKSLRKKLKRFAEFAAMARENPQTSWAFFLPRRKKGISTRKILPILSVEGLFCLVYRITLTNRGTVRARECCGWT